MTGKRQKTQITDITQKSRKRMVNIETKKKIFFFHFRYQKSHFMFFQKILQNLPWRMRYDMNIRYEMSDTMSCTNYVTVQTST